MMPTKPAPKPAAKAAPAKPSKPTFTDALCAMGDVVATLRMITREGSGGRILTVDFARAGHSVGRFFPCHSEDTARVAHAAVMAFAEEADRELPR